MIRRQWGLFTLLIMPIMVSMGCGLFAPNATPTLGVPPEVRTMAAMTAQIELWATHYAGTPYLDLSRFTPTLATATFMPANPHICNAAQLITERMGSQEGILTTGVGFSKTWVIRNVGFCRWTTDYKMVFIAGDRMDGFTEARLVQDVAAGQVIEITVTLRAPRAIGAFSGSWKLSNASGETFGVGNGFTEPFTVQVTVREAMTPSSGRSITPGEDQLFMDTATPQYYSLDTLPPPFPFADTPIPYSEATATKEPAFTENTLPPPPPPPPPGESATPYPTIPIS